MIGLDAKFLIALIRHLPVWFQEVLIGAQNAFIGEVRRVEEMKG